MFPKALLNLGRFCVKNKSTINLQSSSRFFSTHLGIVNIQDAADFKEKVLDNENAVIADFHASWCGPCKLLGPRIESVMKSHMDKVLLAKIDVDEMEELASRFKVSAVPTVIGMKGGKEVSRFMGLKEEAQLEKFIQDLSK